MPEYYGSNYWKLKQSDVFTLTYTESVGTGTAVSVMVTTPAAATAKVENFYFFVEGSNEISLTFSEAPNASGGTAVDVYNLDRDTTTSANSTTVSAITFTSAGTTMVNRTTGANGGTLNGGNLWDLASATNYLIRVSAANASTTVDINATFVEK